MSNAHLLATLILSAAYGASALAESECRPSPPNVARLVEIRPGFHKVAGPLAVFDPCHVSVDLSMPNFWASKLGDKPPLMIIAHGGNGPGSAELEMVRRMNSEGIATLLYDAYAMNGFAYKGTTLFLLGTSNESRQRMIFKSTLGAYRWALQQNQIDTSRIYINGLSNGGSVAVNMAGAVDPAHVRAVIAEGASPTGIGFPDQITVPLKLVYGRQDNYGGKAQDDWMYQRTDPCAFNVEFKLAPAGVSQRCSFAVNRDALVPTPMAWMEGVKSRGQPVDIWFYDRAAHGILIGPIKHDTRRYGAGPTASLRFGDTGSEAAVADRYIADIVALIKSSYP